MHQNNIKLYEEKKLDIIAKLDKLKRDLAKLEVDGETIHQLQYNKVIIYIKIF